MNKQQRKKIEGPVNIEGNVTPITRREIPQVDAQRWNEMNVNELYDQRSVLYSRMVIASQMGSAPLLQQLQQGVSQIDAFIERKTQVAEE